MGDQNEPQTEPGLNRKTDNFFAPTPLSKVFNQEVSLREDCKKIGLLSETEEIKVNQ